MLNANQIARVVHEANRALQIEQNNDNIPVSLSWDDLDSETKASAVEGVLGIIKGNTPRQSHEGWVKFKVEHGWKWGERKDEARKEHPLLIDYALLPADQKLKDDLFSAIVKVLK